MHKSPMCMGTGGLKIYLLDFDWLTLLRGSGFVLNCVLDFLRYFSHVPVYRGKENIIK